MAMDPVTALAIGQAAIGLIQTGLAAGKTKKLTGRRTAYQTPDEIFSILRSTQNRAQQGFDPFTLNYMTNQSDRAFDQASGSAARMGADPNVFAAMLDQKMQGIIKIGAENHALNLVNFEKYLNALTLVADNKAAEWKSKEDIIKDQLQSANADKQAGVQNFGSAANAFIAANASNQTGDLYGRSRVTNRQLVSGLEQGNIQPIADPITVRTARWGG